MAPVTMNAFELISKSQGLNLSSLFEKQMVCVDLIRKMNCILLLLVVIAYILKTCHQCI